MPNPFLSIVGKKLCRGFENEIFLGFLLYNLEEKVKYSIAVWLPLSSVFKLIEYTLEVGCDTSSRLVEFFKVVIIFL